MENYKLTKAIRFKLESQESNSLIQQQVAELENVSFDLVSFISQLGNFIDLLKQYLLRTRKDGSTQINGALSVKATWLKQYAKQIFHESESVRDKTKRRQTKAIGDFENLPMEIMECINQLETTYRSLSDDAIAQLNERARNAHTGLLLKKLASKNGLSFFVDLVEGAVDKYEETDRSIQLKKLGKVLQSLLLAGIQKFLPEQSTGLPIAKASFNYYTLNKKPVDYAQKIREQQSKLSITDWNEQVWGKSSFSKGLKIDIKEGVSDLDALRQKLKNTKAQQKAKFNELMSQGLTFEDLKSNAGLYLFSSISEQEFKNYKGYSEKIETKATQLNQADNDVQKRILRSDLQKLKKERGALINAADRRNPNSFTTYKAFANLYRNIALRHGRILATIKGIEKEAVESQLLQYWSLILEVDGRHKLLLIPKRHAAACYALVANAPACPTNTAHKIYWLESFTLRSLRKLCFGHLEAGTNSFNEHIRDVLGAHKYFKTDQWGKRTEIRIEGEFSFHGDTQKIIAFYKDVLSARYTQSVLQLPQRQLQAEVINQHFESLDDFQIALEKICYKRYALATDQNLETITHRYQAQVLDITTADLEKEVDAHLKQHTQIWQSFWTTENETNNFDVRINPELSILWRPAKPGRVHKYGKESELYDAAKRNRYLQPQFTLVTTISEHSNAPTKVLSFMTDDEFADSVNAFNAKFKKEDFQFALGIDNGETELSTLGVFLPVFQQETYEKSIAALKDRNTHGFKVLSISDLSYQETDIKGKVKKIIQNPSYFLLEEQYKKTFGKTETEYQAMRSKLFKEDTLLTLDLTTAKVIGGHIITNGDVPTFFNLWMRHAQRILWDMNDHAHKATAKHISLKKVETLTEAEKMKFIDHLNTYKNNKEYQALKDGDKQKYTQWVFALWNGEAHSFSPEEVKKFEKVKKEQRAGYFSKFIIVAVCYVGEDLQSVTDVFDVRNIFKLRKDFYAIKSEEAIIQELNTYNTTESRQQIGHEELDLKISHLREALVANAIGVVDYLYQYYKGKTNAEGLIVKEGFDTKKVAEDREKFSGNIYRILERKLYQKFQNYGLVPPIKSLMAVRSEGISDNKTAILRLGNIGFIDPSETSQICPVCNTKFGGHQRVFKCEKCEFTPNGMMHSNDGVAGYNIAQRGLGNFLKQGALAPPTTDSSRVNKQDKKQNSKNQAPPQQTAMGAALAKALKQKE